MRPLRRDCAALFVLSAVLFLALGKSHPWIEADFQARRGATLINDGAISSAVPIASYDIIGPNGRYYDVHGLANTLLQAPLAGAAMRAARARTPAEADALRQLVTGRIGAFVGALTVVMLYVLLRGLDLSRRASLITAAAYACATMLAPFAAMNYEGNLDVLCLVAAVHGAFQIRRRVPARRRDAVLAGVACGGALLGRDSNLPMIGLVVIWVCAVPWQQRRARIVLDGVLAALPFVALYGYYNLLRTGHVYETALMRQLQEGRYPLLVPRSAYGIVSLLVSPGGSIFVYSPPLIAACLGLPEAFRRYRAEMLLLFAFCLLTLVASGLNSQWYGVATWGPRYTNATIPFLLLGLAVWLDTPARASRRVSATAVCATTMVLGGILQLAATLVDWHSRLETQIALDGHTQSDHWSPLFWSVGRSQWFLTLRSLAHNVSYAVTGSAHPAELASLNPGISAGTVRTALTFDTWWNRALAHGMPLWAVLVYLLLSAIVIALCVRVLVTDPSGVGTRPLAPRDSRE